MTHVAAVGLAIAATAAVTGCTATAEANRHTARVAHVPNPAQIKHFDLVAYDTLHPTSASTSRLLGACVVPDHGKLVQVGVARSLSKLGFAHRGEGIALLFHPGTTTTQQLGVA